MQDTDLLAAQTDDFDHEAADFPTDFSDDTDTDGYATDGDATDGYADDGYADSAEGGDFPQEQAAPVAQADRGELSRYLARGCFVALPALQDDATLHIRASDGAGADWNDALVLRGTFGALEVAQGSRLLRALSGIDLDGERGSDSSRWSWLQAAVLGRLSSTPLAEVAVIDFDSEGIDGDDVVTVALSLQSGTHAIHTHARGDAASLLSLLRAGQWQRVRRPLEQLLGLPCRALVSVAQHTLPANALGGIAAGDIIVPDSPRFACDGEGALRVGPLQARVRYEAPGLLTVTALEEKVDALDDNDYDLTEEDLAPELPGLGGFGLPIDMERLAAFDAEPLTLDFALGKVELPLGELRKLDVGAVLPFDGGSPAAITILSAGWTLGRGEIVEVDGQLGIRITQWSTPQ